MTEERTTGEVMISVRDLGKSYRLYARQDDRLKQALFGWRRHYYNEFWALKAVNLELRRGETLAIIGANGAGKSTLLQLICGTLQPTTGSVEVRGRVAALLALGAGFHPQFTGRENVHLAAATLGLSQKEIEERFEAIAEFSGIGEFIDLPVKLYSSGMYARLAFAVCAHVDADILIVDEILSVGDAVFAQKCLRFLGKFREHGTVLFVSHNTGMVAQLCERAIWLERGRLREQGPAGEICPRYLASLSETAGGKLLFRSAVAGDRWWAPEPPQLLSDRRHRNKCKMKVSEFDRTAPWHGIGGLVVEDIGFHATGGERLAEVCGEDEVELRILARAEREVAQPILGFILRDRFGQNVFGDNTFVAYRHGPPAVPEGGEIEGSFRFQMPCLAPGQYSVTVAFIEGTQEDHTHLQWIEDALDVNVTESPVRRGLVALPARNIKIEIAEGDRPN